MQFHVGSFRNGFEVLAATAGLRELLGCLEGIQLSEIERKRKEQQAGRTRKAGIQAGLNGIIHDALVADGWESEVPIFPSDAATGKGFWTMDFAKKFSRIRVGVEVTFNHAEALTWTLIRPTLSHEADDVYANGRIQVGVIIIGTDHLKGRGAELRMDSAVGTYERLKTVLPKMRAVLPAPLVFLGLDWEDGSQIGDVEELGRPSDLAPR